MAKYEWKRAEKALYDPGPDPVEADIPAFGFFVIEGQGDPNGPEFSARVEALYALAYGARMASKNGLNLPGWFEYTVYPLEGVWDLPGPPGPGPLNKADLIYRLMIRQPAFVGPEAAQRIFDLVAAKKKAPLAASARFETLTEGPCVQVTHRGSFDDEPATFARMDAFCRQKGLVRTAHAHREIYLSDPRTTAVEVRKTVLRYSVRDDFSCV